jgi:hypothetical protein
MPPPYGQAAPGWCPFHGWHPLACSTPKGVPQEADALYARPAVAYEPQFGVSCSRDRRRHPGCVPHQPHVPQCVSIDLHHFLSRTQRRCVPSRTIQTEKEILTCLPITTRSCA